jgi:rod shape-determining protein MreC
MFSKRFLTIIFLILFALTNVIFLSISSRHRHTETALDRVFMAAVAPFQDGVIQTIRFCEYIWDHYFSLVSARQQSDVLKSSLDEAKRELARFTELAQTNQRLEELLAMKSALPHEVLSAKVVGFDPSGWYKTIIINRGTNDGAGKGMAVVSPDGIVGQIVTATYDYAKVMLMTDRSSAIDGLVQRTRARGIVEGETDEICRFKYVVRKAELEVGDIVVSSGLDGLFPKGLPIGSVDSISKIESSIFQDVTVAPFVDFNRLEEVLVIVKDQTVLERQEGPLEQEGVAEPEN